MSDVPPPLLVFRLPVGVWMTSEITVEEEPSDRTVVLVSVLVERDGGGVLEDTGGALVSGSVLVSDDDCTGGGVDDDEGVIGGVEVGGTVGVEVGSLEVGDEVGVGVGVGVGVLGDGVGVEDCDGTVCRRTRSLANSLHSSTSSTKACDRYTAERATTTS